MEAELVQYLESRLGVTGVSVANLVRIPGGASRETWMFDASWHNGVEEEQAALILRKDPPASLVETDREVEYSFYLSFAGTDVPVPRMRWMESAAEHLGSPFFIMDRITDCETSTQRIREPDFAEVRPMLARRTYQIMAAIHAADWSNMPLAKIVAAPGRERCWLQELDHWDAIVGKSEISPQPIARAAIRWLRANPPPPPPRVTVVHGDYRVGNFLYSREGIHGILDWELAHLGDPLEDLAWSFMELWEWGGTGMKGGIVDAADAIRIYEEASGAPVDPERLHWWEVLSGVKAQGIWLTGARSFLEGRSEELILAYTSSAFINRQDEIILRAMGRGA